MVQLEYMVFLSVLLVLCIKDVSGSCLNGWELIGGYCYYSVENNNKKKSQDDAKTHCEKYGGYLATFNTPDMINTLSTTFPGMTDGYVGAEKQANQPINQYKWYAGDFSGISLRTQNIPIEGSDDKECLKLKNNELKSTGCSGEKKFICQRAPESPTTTTTPVTTTSPTTSTEPVTTTSPTTSTETVTTTGPTTSTEPVTTTGPTTSTEPVTTTGPTTSTEPVTTTGSTTSTEHATRTGSTSSTEPVISTGSVTSTGPVTSTESTTSTGSATSTGPVTSSGSATSTGSIASVDEITTTPLTLIHNSASPLTGPWTEWSVCEYECKRGSQERKRFCLTPQYHDAVSNSCGNYELTEVRDCLILTNCEGARYYLAKEEMSCTEFCEQEKGLVCSSEIATGNFVDVFNDTILNFVDDVLNSEWVNSYAPYCYNGKCSEYKLVPDNIDCDVEPPQDHQRLCHCIDQGDIGFGPWSPWSQCSQTCEGTMQRNRQCFNRCDGPSVEDGVCGAEFCPIHGGLSEWSGWEACSHTCGGGKSFNRRTCDNPAADHNGNDCVGSRERAIECNVHYCPVDAEWTLWSDWSGCDKPCNTGHKVRRRTCSPPLYGGEEICPGEENEKVECNQLICQGKQATMTLRFQYSYSPDMDDLNSDGSQNFKEKLKSEVLSSYGDNPEMGTTIQDVILSETKKGSVIATFTIYFEDLDSYQFLYLQDSIEVEGSIGKLSILPNGGVISYTVGPDILSVPPADLSALSPSPTSLYITWTPSASPELAGYVLFYRKRLEQSAPYNSLGIEKENSIANLTWLEAGVEYAYRILSFSTEGNGVATELNFKRTMEKIPSAAPTNMTAEANGPFTAYIEWQGVHQNDMNGIPLGYHIYARYQGLVHATANTTFDMQGIVMDGLVPSTSYIFQVCAYNSAGDGPCEQTTSVTFDTVPSAPPLNVRIDDVKSFDQLTIHWEMPPSQNIHGDLVGYKIVFYPLKTGTTIYLEVLETEVIVHSSLTSKLLRNLKANTEYSISVLAMNQYGDGVSTDITGQTCRCSPTVSSNFNLLPPYLSKDDDGALMGVFGEVLDDVVTMACGVCKTQNGEITTILDKQKNGRNSFAEKSSPLRAVQDIDEYTDLSFPLVGSKVSDQFMGYPFVSLVDHPGVVLIVRDKSINEIVLDMILLILSVWPLIVLNIFMMVLAGFLVWLLEGFQAKENVDFSTKWVDGIKEGWYWAFVTQGTHGYGDFAPQKFFSRIFACIWILVGLIMTSLIVGAIVTALTSVNNASSYNIYDTECGALNASFEARLGTLRNGKVNTKKAYTTVEELKDALVEQEIEIVLLDAYTAGASQQVFEHPQLRAQELIKYPRTYGFVLSGDLADVSSEFKDYISVNQKDILSILTNSTKAMEPSPPAETKSPFDPESAVLKDTLIILTVMLVIFSLAGYFFALWKKKRQNAKIEPETNECEQRHHSKCSVDFDDVSKMTDDFHEEFIQKTENLEEEHGEQRWKLFRDRGSSSLRNDKRKKQKNNKFSTDHIYYGFGAIQVKKSSFESSLESSKTQEVLLIPDVENVTKEDDKDDVDSAGDVTIDQPAMYEEQESIEHTETKNVEYTVIEDFSTEDV